MNKIATLFQQGKSIVRSITKALYIILGAPNYEAYLEHFQSHHPGKKPLGKEEFYRKANDEKYGDGKIRRCC